MEVSTKRKSEKRSAIMKTRIIFSPVIGMALGVICVAVILISPAFAAQPVFKTIHYDQTVPDTTCNFPPFSFVMTARYAGTINEAFHYDQAGNLVFERQTFVHFTVTFTNLTNGKSLVTPEPGIARYFPDNTSQDSGIFFLITIPGEGNVLLDVGHLIFDSAGNITFEAGPHQNTTMVMCRHSVMRLPVPNCGERFAFDQVYTMDF